MHRLQQFVIGELIPELRALDEALNGKQFDAAAMNRSFLGEKLMWLHLGSEVGAFPAEGALAAYQEYLAPFFRSIANPKNNLGYTPHSQQSQEMRDLFPHFGQVLIDKALRADDDLFSAEPVSFTNPYLMAGLFQAHWLIRDHVWRSPAVRWFIRVLNFSTDELWESTWEQECSPQEILEADAQTVIQPGRALTYAGFLGLYKYSAQRKQLSESLLDDEILDSTDIFKLEDRIHEIQRWPLKLTSGQVGKRFEKVRAGLVDALRAQAQTDPKVTSEMVSAIQDSIDDALSFAPVGPQVLVGA